MHTLRPKPLITATLAVLVVLLAGSLLPVWSVWVDYSWESVGHSGNLWQALAWLPSNVRVSENGWRVWRLHEFNLVFAAILVGLTIAVGYGVYWWAGRRS